MKEWIVQRVLDEADYMLKNESTVRDCARRFGFGKTTVHKDMRVRLPAIDKALARRVHQILQVNKQERHIRGGLATKAKYLREKEE